MLTHTEAFKLVSSAIERVLGPGLPRSVSVFCQAVGCLESSYGSGWKEPGKNSHNWGAIQHKSPPCNPSLKAEPGKYGCFSYQDTSPQSDGTSKPYAVCFRTWINDEEGVEALVRTVYSARRSAVLDAAKNGNVWAFSAAMYDTGYYQGFGATREIRISHHADLVRKLVTAIERALDGDIAPTPPAGPRVLRRGLEGEDVQRWQELLNAGGARLKADGRFGLLTETATRRWQEEHRLTPDGVVGPKTLKAASDWLSGTSRARETT
ncbi:MAG: peptidoglycan-binding domain-containing protein [Polyangiaceae bacterium]